MKTLDTRMKKYYEDAYRFYLPRRLPVILRVDGKAFHTYTRKCHSPFDDNFILVMNKVAVALCEEIQGAKLAYVQSDEISILIHNYVRLNSSAWFDNNLSKMISVAAGIASGVMTEYSHLIFGSIKRAVFDARAFVLPEAEVCNYFLWRQQDCTKNSIQRVARSLYPHQQCKNKNNSQLQEMIFQKGQNWDKLSTHYKRGRCLSKNKISWEIDNNIPIFSQNREYIEQHLKTEE